MKTHTDPTVESDLAIADDPRIETTIAGEAVRGITDPGEMIHATAIAGAEMILLI